MANIPIEVREKHFLPSDALENPDIAEPEVLGESSASGSAPDSREEADALDLAHEVGLAPDSDEDNPRELNIAEDVANAERGS